MPGLSTRAQAISPDGQYVYGWYAATQGDSGLWRWFAGDGGYSHLNQFDQYDDTQDVRPTPNGEAFTGSSFGTARPRAMVWTPSGGFNYLPEPLGTFASYANSASQTGSTVVGSFVRSGGNGDEAFRWSSQAGFQPLPGTPSSFSGTSARAVSRDGAIIAGNTGGYSCYWDSSNALHLIPVPVGTPYSFTVSESSDGRYIAGTFAQLLTDPITGNVSPRNQAFRYDRSAGVFVDLGFPIDGQYAEMIAMSGDGQTLVASTNGPGRLAIWTASSGWEYVNDLVSRLGIDLRGYEISYISGISDDGRYLMGDCYPIGAGLGSPRSAFRLEIPSPATGSALLGAIVAIALRRRRQV